MFRPPTLLLLFLLAPPPTLAQTSTITVLPTPLAWQDASARCQQLGPGHALYPVPATPTDRVYALLNQQPGDRYWIARRAGGSCTCLNKDGTGDLLEEAPCGDLLPAFCGS